MEEVSGTLETRTGERLKALGVTKPAFDPAALTVYQAGLVQTAFGSDLELLPDLIGGLRMLKSANEITKINAAAQVAEAALAEQLLTLSEGVTEREFAAQLDHAFKRHGAQKASFEPIVLFGSRSSLPHGQPQDKPLEQGDIVLIDCGCMVDGYCSDLTRTYVFGRIPGTWFETVYAVVQQAQQAALDAVRPGLTGSEVDAVARNLIRTAGYGDCFGHGLGHGVGLEVHEAPRLNMQAATVLAPGMVITIEPGIYLPGQGGVRIEDLVVVTETGCQILTRLSKELKQV